MVAILGISALYHDSAAALVVDGEIVAAAQEERFTRRKHDDRVPTNAIEYCLGEAGLAAGDLDHVAFYDKPLKKFDRWIETVVGFAPRGWRAFVDAVPGWLHDRLHVPREIRRALGRGYRERIVFAEHHESHAASAFYPSPFERAAVLTVDGVGEWATASFGTGDGHRLEVTHELRFPHSLGLLYSAFTYHCGFRVNSGEYKLMGLAPYGEPTYADVIREHLVDLRDDGSFTLDQRYFAYGRGSRMTSRRFDDLFGGPPRRPESELTQREMDLAASVQVVTEEIVLQMAGEVRRVTGMQNLCLAGGVALNCVSNGRLQREGPFENVWIQPAAGDAGGALGVALLVWHQLLERPRRVGSGDSQRGSLLGPRYESSEIRAFLDGRGAVYREFDVADSEGEAELCAEVARLLDEQQVVGWLQGRMEFGPRALGSRSILGDARSPEMQSRMNRKIKFRESFRPFAPAVLRERAAEWFGVDESPYMLLTADVAESKRVPVDAGVTGLDRLRLVRSLVPAITHVNDSARLQTVDAERHGRFHRLLRAFEDRTGTPLLVNTSFNVRGEPIVRSPEDAYRCFLATDIDVLVLEGFVLLRDEQPNAPRPTETDVPDHFPLD